MEVASNPVLLHPLSSAGRKAFTKASKEWDKRKRKKHKVLKQERSTFFAASYKLTEPLLSQFSRYLLSTTAPKRKTKRTAEEVNHVTIRTAPQPAAVFLLALIIWLAYGVWRGYCTDRRSIKQIPMLCYGLQGVNGV